MVQGSFHKAFGPGLLLAATAVGVSHLVQSTRAGAAYGLAMAIFILFGLVTKYPTLRFGPQYAAATGFSLLEGFRRQGRWTLVLYAIVTMVSMLTAVAPVALVTAGLLQTVLGLGASPVAIACVLLAGCALLVTAGHYHWLDLITKVLVAILTLSTLSATALVLPHVDWPASAALLPQRLDPPTIAFIVALVGWMPIPVDAAVFHSLWTIARARDSAHTPTLRQSSIDFHLGFIGAGVLAFCFLLLGTGVMHGRGIAFAPDAGGFAAQVIGLYEQTLGAWSRPLIGAAAIAVMLSTLLTIVDAYPRALATLVQRFRGPETPARRDDAHEYARSHYLAFMTLLVGGGIAVLLFLMPSFRLLIDTATTVSFLTAPLIAWIVYRAMNAREVPPAARPGPALRALSVACIGLLAGVAVGYVLLRIGWS